MKAAEHVLLVGAPTAGASGNPRPIDLPNGVTVLASTWIERLPDGTVLEGHGVVPDVMVEHGGPGDATFVRGLIELRRLAQ